MSIADELKRHSRESAAVQPVERRHRRVNRQTAKRALRTAGGFVAIFFVVYSVSAAGVWEREFNHEFCRGNYTPPVASCERSAHPAKAEQQYLEGLGEQEFEPH
jgi:hypothetical protein